jgi:hypothetical protein
LIEAYCLRSLLATRSGGDWGMAPAHAAEMGRRKPDTVCISALLLDWLTRDIATIYVNVAPEFPSDCAAISACMSAID